MVTADYVIDFLADCRRLAADPLEIRPTAVGKGVVLLPTPDGPLDCSRQSREGTERPGTTTVVRKELMHFIQLNMQHAKVPTYELFQDISYNTLACLQEPWVIRDQLKGLLPHLRAIYGANPRAAIVAHKDTRITALPHFTSSHMATVILHTEHPQVEFQQFVVSSWYWPPNAPWPPE